MWKMVTFEAAEKGRDLEIRRACQRFTSRLLRTGLLLQLVAIWAGALDAHAQDATWLFNPGSSDFDTASNWSPSTVPTGTAFFGASNTTTITFSSGSSNTFVGALQFNAGAPAYSFDISSTQVVIDGTGIINNSSNRPTLANTGVNNGTFFLTTSTAGNSLIVNQSVGFTEFTDSSTAGTATITNNTGGTTFFLNTSSAGAATITTNSGSFTIFNDSSSAGTATIITNSGGVTAFSNSSTAGTATVITNSGGLTAFQNTATGSDARVITNAGGSFDISLLSSGGTTVGSIEGAGAYQLGSNRLTTGLNNLSTEVSGTITDGGLGGGTGGSLTKVGTGTLTLSGTNTYTGGTTISTGTLQLGNGGTTGSIAGNVNDNATLAFDRSNTIEFGGLISGTGNLTQIGSGTTILTGNNTYTGGTTISMGTLQVGNGGTIGGIIGNIVNNAALVFDRSDAFTFGGSISGTGAVIENGAGTLTLAGNNTYSGGTILDSGTLIVNSAQALGVGNVRVNGGVLTADPQPINVRGNYFQGPNGTLQLRIAGANPGQYDYLNVSGNAALGGTLQLVSQNFQPKAGEELTLVKTGGIITGVFSRFIDPFIAGPGLNTIDLVYTPHSVVLEFLNLFPPESLSAFFEISFSAANIQRLTLENRLDELRAGSGSVNVSTGNGTIGLDKTAGDGKTSKNPVEPMLQPAPQPHFDLWAAGFGDFVKLDSDFNARGYRFTTGGFDLGFDYQFLDHFAIGVMGSYAHTWTDLQPGSITVNTGRGGLYASYFTGGSDVRENHGTFYVNTGIYGGHNTYDSSRQGLDGNATGNTDGNEWSGFISAGYDFHCRNLTIGPMASLQYTNVYVSGFSETGSLAPLNIHSDSEESLRSDLGFRALYQCHLGGLVLTPYLTAAWEHEFKYSALPITAGFADIAGPSETAFGPVEGHDSAVLTSGLSVQWTPMISTYVGYDGQLGRGRYSSHAVTGGVRVSW
jgi:outer membrane autotransporter protein